MKKLLFIAILTFSYLQINAQKKYKSATLQETIDWLQIYGNQLMANANYDDTNQTYFLNFTKNDTINYIKSDYLYSVKDVDNQYDNREFSNFHIDLKLSEIIKIEALNDYVPILNLYNSNNIFSGNCYCNDSNPEIPEKKTLNNLVVQFKNKEGLLRYYNALKYLYKFKKITNTVFTENISLENKF